MRFGINIINFGRGTTPEILKQWLVFARETGFHLVMISDHVAITPDVQKGFPAPFYDPFLTIAWLASTVGEMEFGTTVTILPYRHPLLTARMAANLDQLTGGRFILGVGVGWARQEFRALGVPHEKRGAIADEYLAIIKDHWNHETISYDGQFVTFENVQTGPRPVRPEGIPIWIGGSSKAAISRAGRFGSSWHPFRFSLKWLKDEALPHLREIAQHYDRPVPSLCPRVTLKLVDFKMPERGRAVGAGDFDQIRADLRSLESLGAQYVLLDTYAGETDQNLRPEKAWEMLSKLADKVIDLSNQSIR